jgi:hypothetical protein
MRRGPVGNWRAPPTPPPRVWLEKLVAAVPINPAAADLAVNCSEITASRKSLPRKPSFFAKAAAKKQQFCSSLFVDKCPSIHN